MTVVDEAQAVVRRGADGERLEAGIAADAIILVDDEVAVGDFGGFGDELVGAPAAARRAGDALAEQVLLADQGEILGDDAALDAQRDQGDAAARVEPRRILPGVGLLAMQIVLAHQCRETLKRAAGPGGDDGAYRTG